jgi:hypothetical protein
MIPGCNDVLQLQHPTHTESFENLAPWHSIALILLEMGAEGVNIAAKNPNVTYGVLGVGTVLALKSKFN